MIRRNMRRGEVCEGMNEKRGRMRKGVGSLFTKPVELANVKRLPPLFLFLPNVVFGPGRLGGAEGLERISAGVRRILPLLDLRQQNENGLRSACKFCTHTVHAP